MAVYWCQQQEWIYDYLLHYNLQCVYFNKFRRKVSCWWNEIFVHKLCSKMTVSALAYNNYSSSRNQNKIISCLFRESASIQFDIIEYCVSNWICSSCNASYLLHWNEMNTFKIFPKKLEINCILLWKQSLTFLMLAHQYQ